VSSVHPGGTTPLRRATARVLPVDDEGRVLLLHGWDPHHPERPFWFTIGGAADPEESLRDAGARELYEETRIAVEPERLGEPIAENSIEFSWGGHRIAQDQWERATTDKYGWLTAEDLEDGEPSAHPDIPDLIRAAVASVRRE